MTKVHAAIQRALYQAALEGDTSPRLVLTERVLEILLGAHPIAAPPITLFREELTGEPLREALKRPGRSQTALARRLGLHVSAINKICTGVRRLSFDEAGIVKAYLVETATFAGDAGEAA